MLKTACLASVFVGSVLLASSAGAADLRITSPAVAMVRVSVAGKSVDQVRADIAVAAKTVCTEHGGVDQGCYSDTLHEADAQFDSMLTAGRPAPAAKVAVESNLPTTIHVSVKGKTQAQLHAEIQTAAQTVCKSTVNDGADLKACVSAAVEDAEAQLRFLAQVHTSQELAFN